MKEKFKITHIGWPCNDVPEDSPQEAYKCREIIAEPPCIKKCHDFFLRIFLVLKVNSLVFHQIKAKRNLILKSVLTLVPLTTKVSTYSPEQKCE